MFKSIIMILFSTIFLVANPVPQEQVFDVKSDVLSEQGILFNININDGIHVNKDSIKLNVDNSDVTNFLTFPKAINKNNSEIYHKNVELLVPFGLISTIKNYSKDALDKFKIELDFNGCADNGFCYPPQKLIFDFDKNGTSYTTTVIKEKKDAFGKNIDKNKLQEKSEQNQQEMIANSFNEKNLFILLLSFFGYGILLSLTPCTLPMIPIVSSIIVSKKNNANKNDTSNENKKVKKTGFLISLSYVLGLSVAYAIAGLLASFIGVSAQTYLQIPLVVIIFSLLFLVLAFGMFGFYEIKIPNFITNFLNNKSQKNIKKTGFISTFIMGLLSALIVGPCIAPPLAGALLYIVKSGDGLIGALALFALGFGMGVPILILGAGSDKLLPKPGFWMNEINKFFGFVLLFVSAWMLSRVVGDNISLLLYSIIGFVMVGAFGLFSPNNTNLSIGYQNIKKGILSFIFVYSTILCIAYAAGGQNALHPFKNILEFKNISQTSEKSIDEIKVSNVQDLQKIIDSSNKPVVVDFWATWCVECAKLDKIFADDDVNTKLKNFTFVRVDVTDSNEGIRALMSKFNVYGPPALIFYKDKKEQKNLQSINPSKDRLLEILNELI